jgi:hypothetical protein
MNYAAQYEEDGPVLVAEVVEIARTAMIAASGGNSSGQKPAQEG